MSPNLARFAGSRPIVSYVHQRELFQCEWTEIHELYARKCCVPGDEKVARQQSPVLGSTSNASLFLSWMRFSFLNHNLEGLGWTGWCILMQSSRTGQAPKWCLLIQVSPPCLLNWSLKIPGDFTDIYMWVSTSKYTHTNQYYLICTFPAKNFRTILSSWNSDWGRRIKYNKWWKTWRMFIWIFCSFCFSTRRPWIKQEKWFLTGQRATLHQKVWRLQFMWFQGEAVGEVLGSGVHWEFLNPWKLYPVQKLSELKPAHSWASIERKNYISICAVPFPLKGTSWWAFPILSPAGLNNFLKEREKNVPSKS